MTPYVTSKWGLIGMSQSAATEFGPEGIRVNVICSGATMTPALEKWSNVLSGVLDIIPYVGSIVGGALPALVALTISPTKAIEVAILFIVVNQIEGNLLQPKIMGGSTCRRR